VLQKFGSPLSDGMQTIKQWRMEEDLGEKSTSCITTSFPRGQDHDVSVTFWISQKEAVRLANEIHLKATWLASPNHPPPSPQT
jgi:hypothetical protein